ncbi:hypothetical protein MKW94_013799 [Papaver nudicaule]|uniref:Branched-chain-amino-acid transaminase n=1 Tax=Papaver nudicaule TaxID=74823 RepID=A0AA41SKR8_PAPNU|nr:hypothetical protein [Papaver nudicaule]
MILQRISLQCRIQLSCFTLLVSRSFFTTQAATSMQPMSESSSAYRRIRQYADVKWDELGFGLVPTDHMYIMKCSKEDRIFTRGELKPYGNIEISPCSGVLNYGQGLFEGLKAYRKRDGNILLFRPEENALRLQMGAKRMCMPSPSLDQSMLSSKQFLLTNVPPPGKESMYIRPLLIGTGPVLRLEPAPECTFITCAPPVGNYYKEGSAPLNLVIEEVIHRATPGGAGGVKTISNYAPVLKAITCAKSRGFSDVIYLDSVKRNILRKSLHGNIFICNFLRGNWISTPPTQGTILSGITRKSIIDIAIDHGYQVQERAIEVEELIHADEVFCTGTAVVVAPVGTGTISMKLHSILTGIQTGLIADKMGWTVELY